MRKRHCLSEFCPVPQLRPNEYRLPPRHLCSLAGSNPLPAPGQSKPGIFITPHICQTFNHVLHESCKEGRELVFSKAVGLNGCACLIFFAAFPPPPPPLLFLFLLTGSTGALQREWREFHFQPPPPVDLLSKALSLSCFLHIHFSAYSLNRKHTKLPSGGTLRK